MAITAEQVKKLRDLTGAGMMDCKKALMKAEGDFDAAEKILKEMGLAAIAKRQDRSTDNGRVFVKIADGKVAMVELSCETDFVAGNAEFAKLGESMCERIIEKEYSEINDELTGMVNDLITVIKENMNVVKIYFRHLDADSYASSYIHGAGSLGVIVIFKSDKSDIFSNPTVQEFANDCALHVAAFTPAYLDRTSVDEAYVAEQTEIFKVQAAQLGKPEKVTQGIVKGKLNKHLSEICFMDQPFVKDDSMSVAKKLVAVGKEVGANLTISDYRFLRAGSEA